MSWGGARVGAGRKPRKSSDDFAPTTTIVPSPGVGAASAFLEPPADLAEAQQAIWKQLAPLAVARRTLIDETVPAFRLLCDLEVKRAYRAPYNDARSVKVYLQIAKQVEALMARFSLAPFGKPLAPPAAAPASAARPVDRYLHVIGGRASEA